MPLLAESNVRLAYNGVTFTTYSSQVKAQPIFDRANRVVKYVRYDITVKAYVEPEAGQTTTDTAMTTLRQKLKEPAAALYYSNKGMGINFSVNAQGPRRDAVWGPHPQVLEYTPIGDSQTALVTWHVVTHVPECVEPDGTVRHELYLCEFVYNIVHSIDDDGYSVISYNGRIEIPMTRRTPTSRTLPDHIDRYREKVKPQLPPGFKRASQNFRISDDKRVMDWDIRDEQVREALPPGVTKFDVSHTIAAKMPFIRWSGSIGGTIVVPPDRSKRLAYIMFLGLVLERLQRSFVRDYDVDSTNIDQQAFRSFRLRLNNQGSLTATGFSMLTDISLGNQVSGRAINCSAKYWFLMVGSLREIMNVSGVAEGHYSNDRYRWRQSLIDNAWDVRGPNGVRFGPQDDSLIDLCLVSTPRLPEDTVTKDPRKRWSRPRIPVPGGDHPPGSRPRIPVPGGDHPGSSRPRIPVPGGDHPPGKPRDRPIDLFEGIDPTRPSENTERYFKPDPERSWLDYKIRVIYKETKPRWAKHVKLRSTPVELLEGIVADADDGAQKISSQKGGAGGSATETKPKNFDEYQDLGKPDGVIYLQGEAWRLGHAIPLPGGLTVNGRECKLNRIVQTTEEVSARVGDILVYHRSWMLEYLVDAPPRQLPQPGNPYLGVNGAPGVA